MCVVIAISISAIGTGGHPFTAQDLLQTSSYCSEAGFLTIPVEGFPTDSLPEGSVSLDLIPVRAADTGELIAGARTGEGWILVDTLVFMDPLNGAKSWAWWDGEAGVIILASQVPFHMSTYFASWAPERGAFTPDSTWFEDPSMEALEETLALLDSGRVEEASSQLYCVLYPDWYYNGGEMAARFLTASHSEAERLLAGGERAAALEVYLCAGDAYQQCGLDSMWFLEPDSLAGNGNPICLWMDDEELIEILEHLALTAEQAGDGATAETAMEAAASLPRR